MPHSIWESVHAERAALADDLAGLSREQWGRRSLCEGWTVHQVLAHQVATATMTPPRFFGKMARSGFRFSVYAEREIARQAEGGPAATLAAFRGAIRSRSAPPGPRLSWLGETIVHAEDIRRPLGIAHRYPVEDVTRLIEFYAGSNALIGGKRRVSGLRLSATDTDFARGTGALVQGPALALLLATTGRKSALADLSGPGLLLLRDR